MTIKHFNPAFAAQTIRTDSTTKSGDIPTNLATNDFGTWMEQLSPVMAKQFLKLCKDDFVMELDSISEFYNAKKEPFMKQVK